MPCGSHTMIQPQSRQLKLLGAVVIFVLTILLISYRTSSRVSEPINGYISSLRRPGKFTQAVVSGHLKDILNSTLGFQKIFAINLPARSDRRDSMSLAADLTDLRIEYVDAVDNVDEKAKPPHDPEFKLSAGYWGSWRSHMNVLRTIVDNEITTALIFEDDADWDIRIKEQMQSFAMASHVLINEEASHARTSYQTTTHTTEDRDEIEEAIEGEHDNDLNVTAIIDKLPISSQSPYGDIDNWDVLWLGHCGVRFPEQGKDPLPRARAVLYDDVTVPEPQHIGIEFLDQAKSLKKFYPPHTRLFHHVPEAACSAAYAVSLPGARRILYAMSTRMTEIFDNMMGEVCGGRKGHTRHKCLSVQPQLFNQHRPAGPKNRQSNNFAVDAGGHRPTAFSRNIRWSTTVNLPKLVDGETDYIDSYPDGAPAANIGF